MWIRWFQMKRIVLVLILLVLITIGLGISFLETRFERSTAEESLAIARMKEYTPIQKITRIDRFHGDDSWMIIWGIDHVDRPIVGWLNSERVEIEMAEFLPRHQEIHDRFMKLNPLAQVVRLSPSMIHGVKSWEIFYKTPDPLGQAYRYDYFKWKSGEPIEVYRLAIMD
jgi:uncharacterized protein YpmB